jgi:dTDP-4-amino-4,6-dideoxygalactose transaminase
MAEWRVRVCDLRAQRRSVEPELSRAVERVLASGWFVLGPEVEAFETEFGRFLGGVHVVGVGSGTEALHLALAASGIGPGDEVLVPTLTAIPTGSAICLTGARPVFCDVDPETGLLDPEDAARRVTPACRAIVPVHLYGRCAPMEPIRELARRHGLVVVEDAAQAHGARIQDAPAGTLGDFGCFSFYPTKNLGAYGDGGAVVTRDQEKAALLRRLRHYGQRNRYEADERGWNSRLDELQAAILRVKLRHLEAWNARRRRLASLYDRLLAGTELRPLVRPQDCVAVEHLYVVRTRRRDEVRRLLQQRGIETQIHYPVPLHLQPAFAAFGAGPGSLPRAERLCGEILSLPLYPELEEDVVEEICRVIRGMGGKGA